MTASNFILLSSKYFCCS